MTTVTVKLPDALLDGLDRAAAAAGITRSELIRTKLEESLVTEGAGSCFDLAGDLMGSIHGLPADLATNPKYMEGFGE